MLGLVVVWALIGVGVAEGTGDQVVSTGHRSGAAAPGTRRRRWSSWRTVKGIRCSRDCVPAVPVRPLAAEVVALTAAGVLMMTASCIRYKMLGLVDWQLLVLFVGLFGESRAGQDWTHGAGGEAPGGSGRGSASAGPVVRRHISSFQRRFQRAGGDAVAAGEATHEVAGPLLALASTLAGNLLIVGSIANIIVVDAAARGEASGLTGSCMPAPVFR